MLHKPTERAPGYLIIFLLPCQQDRATKHDVSGMLIVGCDHLKSDQTLGSKSIMSFYEFSGSCAVPSQA